MLKGYKYRLYPNREQEVQFAKTFGCVWYGRELIIAPRNYASSQLCSSCGHKNSQVKNLAIREWTCQSCNATHDRDVNASKNLLKLAV